MRPKVRWDSGQNDVFKARLDQIVDMDHPLVKLAGTIDWRFWRSDSARSIGTSRVNRRCPRG
jgi:hypothetical protein